MAEVRVALGEQVENGALLLVVEPAGGEPPTETREGGA